MIHRSTLFSPEVRKRAVRVVFDHQGEHDSQYGAIRLIAAKIGCSGETLRNRVRQAERDQSQRHGPTTDEREWIKALKRENHELWQVNEILREASAYFVMGELDRRPRINRLQSTITDRSTGSSRSAERPVEQVRFCRAADRSPRAASSSSHGRSAHGRDPARVRGGLPRIRGAEGLVETRSGRDRSGPLHGRPADADYGAAEHRSGQEDSHHHPGPGRGLPAQPREPIIQGGVTQRLAGQRLHLRRDLGRLHRCAHRDRRLCQAHSRLAGLPHGSRRLRTRRTGASPARTSSPPGRRARAPL